MGRSFLHVRHKFSQWRSLQSHRQTWAAIFFACSGVEMPKPTAQGMSFAAFTSFTIAPISVVIWVLVPVTPREETQYTKPFASFAIRVIRSWDVGAIRNQLQTILFADHVELLFFLKRYIRRISPSIPISAAFLMKRSVP